MPRLAFEEPKGGPRPKRPSRHRREEKRDGVVLALKAATFAVVVALVGAVVLLLTSGEDEPVTAAPDVPEIPTSSGPANVTPTTTPPPAAIVAPEVRSQTAVLTPAPPPAPSTNPSPTASQPRPPEPDRPGGRRFAVVGEPCEDRGSFAFTAEYEPVVCGGDRPSQPLVWREMF